MPRAEASCCQCLVLKPIPLIIWTKRHLVPNFQWGQISTLLVMIRLGITLSLMKRFQNMILIHWLR